MSSRPIQKLAELKAGDRVLVAYEPGYGLHNGIWFGPGAEGTVIGQTPHGEVLVMMAKRNYYGSFALDQSRLARNIAAINPGLVAGATTNGYQFFWVTYPASIRMADPTYLAPQTHKGPVTCKCGFTNCDVSVSAIVNGQYLCYNCRVISPRERAA